MSDLQEKEDRERRAIDQGAAQFAVVAASNAANAADFIDTGWAAVEQMLSKEAKKLGSPDPRWGEALRAQARGNVFEAVNDLHDNIKRAESGQAGRWKNTRLSGENRSPADSEICIGGKVVLQRQDKLLLKPSIQNLKSIAHEKYAGMQIAIPADDVAEWKAALLRAAEATDDPDQKVRFTNAASRVRAGVRRKDLSKVIDDPKGQKSGLKRTALAKEAATAAGAAALGAGVVAGAVSTIRNGLKLYQGDITKGEATVAVATDAGISALRAGSVAVIGVGIRHAATKFGVEAFKKGGPPGVVAAAVMEVGFTVYGLAKGQISPEEAMVSLGETGCCAVAGLYAGGAAVAAFGNLGVIPLTAAGIAMPLAIPAILASMAAYTTVSLTYQTCIQILKVARLEQEEAERVIALAVAAEAELIAQRFAFEQAAEEYFREQQQAFGQSFAVIDQGMSAGDVAATIAGLARLAAAVGGKLRFAGYEEFEQFMEDSDIPLVL